MDSADRKAYFDSREAEALSKTASDDDHAKLGQLLQTELFHFVELSLFRLKVNTVWDLGSKAVEGIDIVL